MEMKEIAARLSDYIKEEFDIGDDPDFDLDVHLFDSGFVDSLGATEIILHIEQEYGIKISAKDIILYPMNTINEISEVVANKLAGK